MSDSTRIFRPAVGVVTAIGGDHRKAFGGSWTATAAEKAQLVHTLPKSGLAVINADDPLVAKMAGDCRCRVVTFGRSEGTNLKILDASSVWPDRLRIDYAYDGDKFTVQSRLVGTHWTLSLSAALLTALELGANRKDCLDTIEKKKPIFNRMSVHPGTNGAWYILDAGKASFHGIEACLDFLDDAGVPRKTIVLGTISDYSGARRSHYYKVARIALEKADRVIFTGKNASSVRRLAAGEFSDRLQVIERSEELTQHLVESAIPNELIYVKSSRVDRLRSLFLSRPLSPTQTSRAVEMKIGQ